MRFPTGSATVLAATLCTGVAAAPREFTDPLRSGGVGPVMVEVTASEPFEMGWFRADHDRRGWSRHSLPRRTVQIEDTFAMSRDEVTVAEFALFAKRTGYLTVAERSSERRGKVVLPRRLNGTCIYIGPGDGFHTDKGLTWRYPGYAATDRHPVGCIARADAVAYAEWLAAETGRMYRLPSEAEWEYAARTNRSDAELRKLVEMNDPAIVEHLERGNGTPLPRPVDRREANRFGLRGLGTFVEDGWTVAEWTADCWRPDYKGAPDTGDPRMDGDCARGVLRGDLIRPFASRNALGPGRDSVEVRNGIRVVISPLGGPFAKRGRDR